ncbi:MAG: hypothetical protein MUP81_02285 [Dehalococcoidia bacterium]|nr:hypothetical protein [Dehalococcoidia bacterium]
MGTSHQPLFYCKDMSNKLYYCLTDEDQEKIRLMAKALGIKDWKPPDTDMEIESLAEIDIIMRQPPHYRGKPGKSYGK